METRFDLHCVARHSAEHRLLRCGLSSDLSAAYRGLISLHSKAYQLSYNKVVSERLIEVVICQFETASFLTENTCNPEDHEMGETREILQNYQKPYLSLRSLNAFSPPSITCLIASQISGMSMAPTALTLPPDCSLTTR